MGSSRKTLPSPEDFSTLRKNIFSPDMS
jgi:hypothetical protein